mgnify:CR=1 FL=1
MKQFILFLSFFINLGTYAQEEFSFFLYFEDAIGNKDSLQLGHDENATDSIDVDFDEINIVGESWDPEFEVRCGKHSVYGNYFNYNGEQPNFQSKKQIGIKECNNEYFAHCINLKAENFPIVIRWDSTLFNYDECLKGSKFNIEPVFQTDAYTELCRELGSTDSNISTFNIDSVYITENHLESYYFEYYFDNEDTIYLFWISLNKIQDYSMGIETLENVTNSKTYSLFNENDLLEVDFNTGHGTVIDVNGKKIKEFGIRNGTSESLFLKEGLYYLLLYDETQNKTYRSKIIQF